MVRRVKFCCPLNHFVTSLGLQPIAKANSFFDILRDLIRKSIFFAIAKERSVSIRI